MDGSTEEQQMALSTESWTLNIAIKVMLSKKITKWIKVFIFGVDPVANVKTPKMLWKILHKVFSFMKIFKFLQGLVGFGNFRFAKIKSHPSTYRTEISPLLKMLRSWIFWAFTQPPVGVGDNIEKNYRQPINRHFSNYRWIIDIENWNCSIIDKIIDIEKCIKFEPINTHKKLW